MQTAYTTPISIMYETVGPDRCPTCQDQGGWLDGDMYTTTHWQVCPDCGPRAVADLHSLIGEIDEVYAEPGIDMPYRRVRKLVAALKYVESRLG